VGGGGRPLLGALPSRPGEEPSQIAHARQTLQQINWQTTTPLTTGLTQTIQTKH
jgi:hypothetical protein